VLHLEWYDKAVDDGTEDLKKFGNAIMSFRFVDKMIEDIVDRATNESTEVEHFAIKPMQSGLEKISLTRVFRVEQFEEIEDEKLVNVWFCKIQAEIGAFEESKEKLVDNLEMRPC